MKEESQDEAGNRLEHVTTAVADSGDVIVTLITQDRVTAATTDAFRFSTNR